MRKCNCDNNNNNNNKIQKFPSKDILYNNLNYDLNELKKILGNEIKEIRTYALSTIELDKNNNFIQKGCAPNWQGGYITLCTCKHKMRTAKEKPTDWEKSWIAGIKICERNNTSAYLIYLMEIEKGFQSMYEIWNYFKENVRIEKSAKTNNFGDLFEPKKDKLNLKDIDSLMNPCNYEPPNKNHVHLHNWYFDIHSNYNNKYPAYLVGNPQKSFLWSKPMILIKHPDGKKFTQGGYGKIWVLNEFQENLINGIK